MERLQKILAARGLASRREAEQWISEGRVSVNGRVVTELGTKADPERDRITVRGRLLPAPQAPRVLAVHKPVGYVSTCRTGRETGPAVVDLVPGDRRYFPVGRLDQNSSGLMLLTDDGALAQRLMHPRHGVRKVYLVSTVPPLDDRQIARLLRGIPLEEGLARAVEVDRAGRDRLRMTLAEGRKRQIRRMIEAVGARVTALQRVQIGGLRLGALQPGQWRELRPAEIARLLDVSASPSSAPSQP